MSATASFVPSFSSLFCAALLFVIHFLFAPILTNLKGMRKSNSAYEYEKKDPHLLTVLSKLVEGCVLSTSRDLQIHPVPDLCKCGEAIFPCARDFDINLVGNPNCGALTSSLVSVHKYGISEPAQTKVAFSATICLLYVRAILNLC